MTTALILNIAFAVAVLGALLGHHLWSILTQHRDRGVVVAPARVYRHPAWGTAELEDGHDQRAA